MPKKYTSKPLSLAKTVKKPAGKGFADTKTLKNIDRAYLELHGIETVGASYVGRIFFNNPSADENTPMTPDNGYAGCFSVFGHGGCGGDPGHCDRKTGLDDHDHRPPNTARDGFAVAPVTDALQKAINQGQELTFTIVPVILSAPENIDTSDPVKFKEYDFSIRLKQGTKTKKMNLLKAPQPM